MDTAPYGAMMSDRASPLNPGPAEAIVVRIAEALGAKAQATTIFGDAVERDGVIVIPVAKARWGFGGGGGLDADGTRSGSGGGGAVDITPVGYIELRNGESRFRPIRDPLAYVPFALVVAGLVVIMRALGRRG